MESEDVANERAGALWHPVATARRLVAELRHLQAVNRDPAFTSFRERHLRRHVLATVLIGVPMLVTYHAMDLALGLPGARRLLLVRLAAAAALLAAGALFFVRRSPGKDRVQLACTSAASPSRLTAAPSAFRATRPGQSSTSRSRGRRGRTRSTRATPAGRAASTDARCRRGGPWLSSPRIAAGSAIAGESLPEAEGQTHRRARCCRRRCSRRGDLV